jgi:hypothetical protein
MGDRVRNHRTTTAARATHPVGWRFILAVRAGCSRRKRAASVRRSATAPREFSRDHLQEFGEAWQGMERQWHASLAPPDRDLLDELTTATEQSAFRIIESWSRHEALARRLGISRRGAGTLRQRFCKLGILTKISDYVPHKRSACFAWLPTPLTRGNQPACEYLLHANKPQPTRHWKGDPGDQ